MNSKLIRYFICLLLTFSICAEDKSQFSVTDVVKPTQPERAEPLKVDDKNIQKSDSLNYQTTQGDLNNQNLVRQSAEAVQPKSICEPCSDGEERNKLGLPYESIIMAKGKVEIYPGVHLCKPCGKCENNPEQGLCDNPGTPGCSEACTVFKCGDHMVTPPETCEPIDLAGNVNPNCRNNCSSCGDKIKDPEEECEYNADNTNPASLYRCSSNCKQEKCGDLIVQTTAGEECDDGNNVNNDTCTNSCKLAKCGDGIVQLDLQEECDDKNNVDNDACSNLCQLPVCGDGITQKLMQEYCDDGNLIDDDECPNSCQAPKCGDGIVQLDLQEECDDENKKDGDGCSKNCQLEEDPSETPSVSPTREPVVICGNRIVEAGEECDDGNKRNNDYCKNNCRKNFCGDGVRGPGEQCDDANKNNNDSCNNKCKLPVCGDGVVQGGEKCDDGNRTDYDGCNADCKKKCDYVKYSFEGEKDGQKVFRSNDINISNHSCLRKLFGGKNLTQKRDDGSDDGQVLSFWQKIGIAPVKRGMATTTTFYFDSKCKVHKSVSGGVCGTVKYGFTASPVSLELDATVDQEWNLVKFPLKPGNSSWVAWKASAETPLLVYDPSHSGIVKDGSQLFGNYTVLNSNSLKKTSLANTATSTALWNHGYEALAQLDLNHDSKISGSELDVIALWFDKNRNGISEAGEVVSAKNSGLMSLTYQVDGIADNGDIYVNQGFKINRDGKVFVGRTVDWFSEVHKEQSDLLGSFSKRLLDLSDKKDHTNYSEQAVNENQGFSGVWQWESSDEVLNSKPLGLLLLDQSSDGVTGASFVEETLQSNPDDLVSYLSKYSLYGDTNYSNGKVYINFTVIDGGSEVVQSKAYIDEQGILIGESTALIDNAGSQTELKYTWKAKRVD